MKENWTYKKVKEVCDKASSNIVLNKIEDNSGEYPLYGASGLVKGIDFYHRDEPYIGVVKDGSGVGRVDVYPAKSSLVGTMQYILPKADVLLQYLCYALQGLKLSRFVMGAAIPHIYFKEYGECTIPVPPVETQSRIVSELDLLQSIIDKQQAQLKELDTLAQAVFYDMFGDPVENEKGWERIPFESSIQKVKYTTKLQSKDYLDSGKYPIISQEEEYISGYWNNDEDLFRVVSPVVIFGDHTRILKYVDFSFVLGADGVKIFLPISAVTPWYLYYFLKSSNIPSLGYSRHYKLVKELTVPIPPLDLQQSFAAKIESIEKQKNAIGRSIEETQKLFDYTMDKYFG